MEDLTIIIPAAWNAARNEHSPDYDGLADSYREMLTARAEGVAATHRVLGDEGVLGRFEQNVLEALIPERFH